MQTFLPFESFVKSAKVLDMRRLGKQRVEAYQILRVLSGEQRSRGWKNHPAVKMWESYELTLAEYGLDICQEWVKRGYRDTLTQKFYEYIERYSYQALQGDNSTPLWLGNPEFHASHRSNLLRKNPEWYNRFGWSEPDNIPYVWPTKQDVV